MNWRVRELASRRGFSARRLAEASGLDEKTVRNILSGRATRVDLETVARLSQALEVTPGALWDIEPEPSLAWERTAGSAGQARPGELDDLLAGSGSVLGSPALERAVRTS